MKVKVLKDSNELGKEAAMFSAKALNKAIVEKGKARIVLSTGASQFDTLKYLVKMNVDWQKVEMFHLDEYVGLPEDHPASFRKYLKERFINIVHPGKIFFINGEDDFEKNIRILTQNIREEPIDLALVGIGENGHIAFNDPPADFETKEAYIVVNLDEKCRKQQIREGWFLTTDDVPKQAISMTVYQIMQSKVIVSAAPYKVKAEAIKLTLENDITANIPATMLKKHRDATIFLEKHSSVLVSRDILNRYLT